jgi:hypothetical protein
LQAAAREVAGTGNEQATGTLLESNNIEMSDAVDGDIHREGDRKQ